MFSILISISHQAKSKYLSHLRTIGNSTKINVEVEMKKFNDKQQYMKALDLFDQHEHQIVLTDRLIVQALKACSQLGHFERGQIIHKKLPNNLLDNNYVQTSLINFYGKYISFDSIETVSFSLCSTLRSNN